MKLSRYSYVGYLFIVIALLIWSIFGRDWYIWGMIIFGGILLLQDIYEFYVKKFGMKKINKIYTIILVLIVLGIFFGTFFLLYDFPDDKEDNKYPLSSVGYCETFVAYEEKNPNLLPVDSIEKVKEIKNNLPKCPTNNQRPGCIVDIRSYDIKEIKKNRYSIVRSDDYGLPLIVDYNGTVIWTRCLL